MGGLWNRELCVRLNVPRGIDLWGRQRCTRFFNTTSPRSVKSKTKQPQKPQKPQTPTAGNHGPKPYQPKIKIQPQSPIRDFSKSPMAAFKRNLAADPAPKPPVNPLLDANRRYPLIGAGIMVFCIAGYIGYFATTVSKQPSIAAPSEPSAQPDVSVRCDKIARKFDSSIDGIEISMGMPEKRRAMISEARGHVLEVSVGTGRNLDFYDWNFQGHNGVGEPVKGGGVKSLTAIDISKEMVEVAREKFARKFPGMPEPRWVVGDASLEMPPPPHDSSLGKWDQKYDTIIQTMGLCSVSDPVALLRNLGNHVKENEGRILLLEHGRGTWQAVNYVLDKTAVGHALEHGCWWNRDIEAIVKESGLEIVKTETWHFGTTWRVELRKPMQNPTEKSMQNEALAADVGQAKKGSTWSLW